MRARLMWARSLPLIFAVALVCATGPSVARAQDTPVTFGPDLSQLVVNNTNDCTLDPLILPPGNRSERVGRIARGPGIAPTLIITWLIVPFPRQSAPFTPTANAISTEPVNLPVEVDTTPNPANGLQTVDLVGLSVLEDRVPVPAADETTLSPEYDQPSLDVEEPAMQDNGVPQLADDGTGYLVAMDSVWVPQSPGAAPTPGPNPTAPGPNPTAPGTAGGGGLAPVFSFPSTSTPAQVSGQNALVDLACGATGAACHGAVSLQSAPAHATGAHAACKEPGAR